MAILKVARMGHPVLRAVARPIAPADIRSPRIQRLIDDMFETMHEYSGIGLAAPQVHESVRLFVAGVRETDAIGEVVEGADMPMMAILNPELKAAGPELEEDWEGCLSIPDIRGRVERPAAIDVAAYDRNGRRIRLRATGLPARVIQHETDHLDGVLFFDRMKSFETLSYLEEHRRYWTKHEDDEDE